MELLSYLVLNGNVKHGGVRYGEGELILLSVEDAKPLQASGYIGLPKQEGPAVDEPREEVPELGSEPEQNVGPREEVPTVSETEPAAFLVHLPPESSGKGMQPSEPTKQVGKVSSPGRARKTV